MANPKENNIKNGKNNWEIKMWHLKIVIIQSKAVRGIWGTVRWDIKKIKCKMTHVTTTIITLNVNRLNNPNKNHWVKNTTSYYVLSPWDTINIQSYKHMKGKIYFKRKR